jgi:cytochrome c5
MITFTTVISVLVLIAVAIFLAARMISLVSVQPEDSSRKQATAEERIKPVGQVALSTSSAPPAVKVAAEPAQPMAKQPGETAAKAEPAAPAQATAAVDLSKGKSVYNSVCLACHSTGAAGAPKIGDKAAWEPREKQGIETLISHAVNGIRAMPAKGGNPALTESDIHNAIAYMLSETGIEVAQAAAPVPPAATAAAPAPSTTPPAAAAPAPAPSAQVTAKTEVPSAEQQAAQKEVLAAVQKAIKAAEEAATAAREAAAAAREAAAAARETAAADREIAAAAREAATAAREAAAAAQAGPTTPESTAPDVEEYVPAPTPKAPAIEGTEPTPEEESAPAPTSEPATHPVEKTAPLTPRGQAAAAAIKIPPDLDLSHGKQLYNTSCIICHKNGAGGAPALADKAAWTPRLARGFDALVNYSLTIHKQMYSGLADQDIIAAVGYMVSTVQ